MLNQAVFDIVASGENEINEENEVNDFDINPHYSAPQTTTFRAAICFDSGEIRVVDIMIKQGGGGGGDNSVSGASKSTESEV